MNQKTPPNIESQICDSGARGLLRSFNCSRRDALLEPSWTRDRAAAKQSRAQAGSERPCCRSRGLGGQFSLQLGNAFFQANLFFPGGLGHRLDGLEFVAADQVHPADDALELLLQALLVGLFGIETREKPLEALTPWRDAPGGTVS